MVGRAAALLGLAVCVGAYYGAVSHLPTASLWWEIAWLAFVVMPAIFALVGFALPLAGAQVGRLALAGGGLIVLTVVLNRAGFPVLANFGKLAAMTCLAWAFLWLFEELSWVVAVALLIPWVDIYSVFWGPTKTLTNAKHENIFSAFSFSFPLPDGSATRLGLPDLYFYALFLGAAARFGLRLLPTWILLTASFGATMALAVWATTNGLPALPLLAVGFLLPNADLIWRRLRQSK